MAVFSLVYELTETLSFEVKIIILTFNAQSIMTALDPLRDLPLCIVTTLCFAFLKFKCHCRDMCLCSGPHAKFSVDIVDWALMWCGMLGPDTSGSYLVVCQAHLTCVCGGGGGRAHDVGPAQQSFSQPCDKPCVEKFRGSPAPCWNHGARRGQSDWLTGLCREGISLKGGRGMITEKML